MFLSLRKKIISKGVSVLCGRHFTGQNVDSDSLSKSVKVGDNVEVNFEVTTKHVWQFCGATGDTNPIHWDPAAAREKGFEDRVVHGVLVVGLVSGVIGTRLPGPGTVLVRQSINHRAPLYVEETANVRVEIAKIRKFIDVNYVVKSKDRNVVVLEGVATVKFKG